MLQDPTTSTVRIPPQVLAYPVFSKITNLFWTCFESHLIYKLCFYKTRT